MAELLLLANPAGIRASTSDALSVDFDSIAELRGWLRLAGLDTANLLTGERDSTDTEGRPYRSAYAYPVWHGWKIYAYARDYTDTAAPLDPATTDQLTALVVAG
ncbi:hypothetical protein O7606_07910 [Micromonospora sp. WMMD882]|uniref:hypothetical protein n=1 Tax=Micromonospora sp. WMMD882 TaxID=3015151 RepID=UPI00248C8051|nr:hypothetical protein [Micromonospora sp. WMMD882]WBB82323.1 hypothetical protein O7606_07910 [Micromonospora sp. WMMD882]